MEGRRDDSEDPSVLESHLAQVIAYDVCPQSIVVYCCYPHDYLQWQHQEHYPGKSIQFFYEFLKGSLQRLKPTNFRYHHGGFLMGYGKEKTKQNKTLATGSILHRPSRVILKTRRSSRLLRWQSAGISSLLPRSWGQLSALRSPRIT